MAGKRLAAAGVLAAAVAAAAALWAAPSTPLAAAPRAIRHVQAAVTAVELPRVRVPDATPTWQSAVRAPIAVRVARGVLIALLLVGTIPRLLRRPAPAVARPPRRGRSPPPLTASHRVRDH